MGLTIDGDYSSPKWTTAVLTEIAWFSRDWPDYIMVTHTHASYDAWHKYVPSYEVERLKCEADEVLLLEKEVARLKAKMEEWARLFEDNARDHEQYGHWMEAEDWFEYAHDMRIDMLPPDSTEKVQA